MAADNALFIWDFTVSAKNHKHEQAKVQKDEIIAWCNLMGKKWAFQKERGNETGYEHYQCRISLKEKVRLPKNKGWHFTPTSGEGSKTFSYVMKEDTRIEGPWTDKDTAEYIPVKFRGEFVYRGWQKKVMEAIESMEDRKIILLTSKEGNKGKSWFQKHLKFRHNWVKLAATLVTAQDIMRAAMNKIGARRVIPGICIDIPRSVSKKHMWTIGQAIECLLEGECYDDRYKFSDHDFEPCPIVVSTNWMPDLKIFSKDRWIIIDVNNS